MIPAEPTGLTISDDSSIFGLVDVARYKTFVDPDWSLDQLVKHFRSQARSLVVWYGGDSGLDSVVVRVSRGITEEPASVRSPRRSVCRAVCSTSSRTTP